ncbi:phosphate-binding protein, partial [Bacillus sp. JJ1764]
MKSLKRLSLFTLLTALMVFMAACGGDKTSNKSGEEKDQTKKTEELSGSLVISGSSAMQPLIAAAAEEFMNEHSKVDI